MSRPLPPRSRRGRKLPELVSVTQAWPSRADDRVMTEPQQPWQVFMRRGAPLATLFQSEHERMRADRVRAGDVSLDAGPHPLADPGVPPVAPDTTA